MTTLSAPIGHQRHDSKYAQQDLWSRITGESSSPSVTRSSFFHDVPRYAAAQHGRTLHHPLLEQPTTVQEEHHLAMLAERRQVNIDRKLDTVQQQELVEKLSKALLLGSNPASETLPLNTVQSGEKESENFPSPTSTLCFPDSHNDPSFNHALSCGSSGFELSSCHADSFIGTCGLVSSELEKMKKPQDYLQQGFEVESVSTETANVTSNVGELEPQAPCHSFVICSDTQLGIASQNIEWETELEYSRQAVCLINSLNPPPRFVCVCGDLIDMEYTFEQKRGYSSKFKSKEECDEVQDQQNKDFQRVWRDLRPDVALVCLCGNHDIGNRPTPSSIQRYKDAFGDEFLAFWLNGTYNIVLNNVLFVDPSGAKEIFQKQLAWLEERLRYSHEHDAKMVFVFGHHPWFLVSLRFDFPLSLFDKQHSSFSRTHYSTIPITTAV